MLMSFVDLLVHNVFGIEPVLLGEAFAASAFLLERIGLRRDPLPHVVRQLEPPINQYALRFAHANRVVVALP